MEKIWRKEDNTAETNKMGVLDEYYLNLSHSPHPFQCFSVLILYNPSLLILLLKSLYLGIPQIPKLT